jgi:GNAT superfamily N-acetyltransferase
MNNDAERDQSEIEIRLATADDAPLVSDVLLQAFIEYRSLYTEAGFAATTPDVEQIKRRMIEGPIWIALRHDTVIGTVSAVLQGESVYVRGMAVLPEARGHRTGELLMNEIELFAFASKCRRLYLSTTPFLDRAIALYGRLGFNRIDEGPHDLYGTPLLTMARTLEPMS